MLQSGIFFFPTWKSVTNKTHSRSGKEQRFRHHSTLSLGPFMVASHCLSWLQTDFTGSQCSIMGATPPFRGGWKPVFPSLEQSTVRPLTHLPLQFTGWWPTSLSMKIQSLCSAVLSSSGALLATLREPWAPSATASSLWSSPSSLRSSSCRLRLWQHCRSWGRWRMPEVSPQWLLPCWGSMLSALAWGGPWCLV